MELIFTAPFQIVLKKFADFFLQSEHFTKSGNLENYIEINSLEFNLRPLPTVFKRRIPSK